MKPVVEPNRRLLLSIHPKYVEKILSGEKTIELRRRAPRLAAGSPLLIYATVPVKSLVAVSWIEKIVTGPLVLLWQRVRDEAAVSREDFNAYFTGTETGAGICVKNVTRLSSPLPLDELRDRLPGFHPPQSFRYLTDDEVESLDIRELRVRRRIAG
ncbi:MAG: ASCH domain-containing protein [Pirellulales bacterium]